MPSPLEIWSRNVKCQSVPVPLHHPDDTAPTIRCTGRWESALQAGEYADFKICSQQSLSTVHPGNHYRLLQPLLDISTWIETCVTGNHRLQLLPCHRKRQSGVAHCPWCLLPSCRSCRVVAPLVRRLPLLSMVQTKQAFFHGKSVIFSEFPKHFRDSPGWHFNERRHKSLIPCYYRLTWILLKINHQCLPMPTLCRLAWVFFPPTAVMFSLWAVMWALPDGAILYLQWGYS